MLTKKQRVELKKLIKESLQGIREALSFIDRFNGFSANKAIYNQILQEEFMKRKKDLAAIILNSHLPYFSMEPISDDNPRLIMKMSSTRIFPRLLSDVVTTVPRINDFISKLNYDHENKIIKDEEEFISLMTEIEEAYKDDLDQLKQKIKINRDERAKVLSDIKVQMSQAAEQDAQVPKKYRSAFYFYFKEVMSEKQKENLLGDIVRFLQNAHISLYGINSTTLCKFLDRESEAYNKAFDDALQKVQQLNLAAKQGRGSIEGYWGSGKDATYFLDWLYRNTDAIKIKVGDEDQINNIIEITPSDISDFSDKITVAEGRWYQSWELFLNARVRKEIDDMIAKPESKYTYKDNMLKRFMDWEIAKFKTIQKGGEAQFEDRHVYQERENKMTGNEIIKDLVFSYGFNDKIN